MRLLIAFLILISAASGECRDKIILTGTAVFGTCPMIMMAEDKLFEANGFDAEFIPWNTPDQYRALISSGKQVYALISTLEYVRLNKSVRDMSSMFTVEGSQLWFMGRKEKMSLDDLREETVALPFRGDMPEIMLGMLLAKRGLSTEDVKIVSAGGAVNSAQLVMTGKAGSVMLPEPVAGTVKDISSSRKGLVPLYYSLSVEDEWNRQYNGNPPLVLNVISSFSTGKETDEIFMKYYGSYFEQCKKSDEAAVNAFIRYFPSLDKKSTGRLLSSNTDRLKTLEDGSGNLNKFISLMGKHAVKAY